MFGAQWCDVLSGKIVREIRDRSAQRQQQLKAAAIGAIFSGMCGCACVLERVCGAHNDFAATEHYRKNYFSDP